MKINNNNKKFWQELKVELKTQEMVLVQTGIKIPNVHLVQIYGIMDSTKYQQRKHLTASARNLIMGRGWTVPVP